MYIQWNTQVFIELLDEFWQMYALIYPTPHQDTDIYYHPWKFPYAPF